jgi:hypothetical protein
VTILIVPKAPDMTAHSLTSSTNISVPPRMTDVSGEEASAGKLTATVKVDSQAMD